MKKDSFKFVEDLFLRRADTAYLKNAIESAVDTICGLGENKKFFCAVTAEAPRTASILRENLTKVLS